MKGYCESCAEEVESVVGDQLSDECPQCGDDVHPGLHIEQDEDGDVLVFEDEADFDEWLLKR